MRRDLDRFVVAPLPYDPSARRFPSEVEKPVLYGRNKELDRLLRSDSSLTVVAGDSGTGKTSLLSAAQVSVARIEPMPVEVHASPGSLQMALLEAIALGVEQFDDDEGPVRHALRIGRAAAERLAVERLDGLTTAVGAVLLDILRRHLGTTATDLMQDAAAAVTASRSEELGRRIASQGDADVVRVALELAAELSVVAERDVVIALDDVHKLDDDDHRRLLDLTRTAPEGVRVRAAFTRSPSSASRHLDLAKSGALLIELTGLEHADVVEWAGRAGVSDVHVDRIMLVTNGVAFHVKDAFDLIDHDLIGDLEGLASSDLVRVRTQEAWSTLDDEARRAASILALLSDRPSSERCAAMVGVDEPMWFALRQRLIESGMLLDQSLWFHELRRLCLVSALLAEDQIQVAKRVIVQNAVETLEARRAIGDPDVDACFRNLGEHLSTVEEVLSEEPGVNEVLGLSGDQLRTLVAILELNHRRPQPDGTEIRLVDANVLIAHLNALTADVDALPLLPQLEELGLIRTVRGSSTILLIDTFASNVALWIMQGRSLVELGRLPLRDVGEAIFDALLKPHLGRFHAARYGVGIQSLSELAESARQLFMVPKDGVIISTDRWTHLVIRGRFAGDTPFDAVVGFDLIADRDAAHERLQTLEQQDLFGTPFKIENTFRFPGKALPLNRFVNAYAALRQDDRSGDTPPPLLSDVVRRAKAFLDIVRRHVSALEAEVLGIARPVGFRFAASPDEWAVIAIDGIDTSEETALEQLVLIEPEDYLGCVRRLGLPASARLRWRIFGIGGQPTRDQALAQLMEDLRARADRYNQAQVRVQIDYTIDALRPMLSAGFAKRQLLLGEISREVLGREHTAKSLLANIDIHRRDDGWVPGAIDLVTTFAVPAGTVGPDIYLAQGTPPTTRPEVDQAAVNAHFGLDADLAHWDQSIGALEWIADLLGHNSSEIRLQHPEDRF